MTKTRPAPKPRDWRLLGFLLAILVPLMIASHWMPDAPPPEPKPEPAPTSICLAGDSAELCHSKRVYVRALNAAQYEQMRP